MVRITIKPQFFTPTIRVMITHRLCYCCVSTLHSDLFLLLPWFEPKTIQSNPCFIIVTFVMASVMRIQPNDYELFFVLKTRNCLHATCFCGKVSEKTVMIFPMPFKTHFRNGVIYLPCGQILQKRIHFRGMFHFMDSIFSKKLFHLSLLVFPLSSLWVWWYVENG